MGKKTAVENRIEGLKSEVKQMAGSLKRLSREVEVLGVEEGALSQRMGDLEGQAREQVMDPAQLQALEGRVREFEGGHRRAAEAAGKVQKEVDR